MESSLELLRQLSKAHAHSQNHQNQPSIHKWLDETKESIDGKPLRVLIVLSQQPSETGSGIFLREVVEKLQNLGHKPYLLAAHYRSLSSIDFPFLTNDQIYTIVFNNKENSNIAEINFAIPGMSRDMPYLYTRFQTLSETMLNEYCRVWIAKLQTVVETIHPHLIHVNHLWLLPGIARVAIPWIPIVATSHGTDYKLLLDTPSFSPLVLPGVQLLDAVMPISNENFHAVVRAFGVHPSRIRVIGNGYNEHLFRILPKKAGQSVLERLLAPFQSFSPWDKLVLYVGKFADYKGIPYLIQAAKVYGEMSQDNILTLIVGEGSKSARASLEKLVDDLNLQKRVLLPGKIPYSEVGPLMNVADLFVLPSVDEPFGLVLLEAMACGLRSVAADRGGPSFFVPRDLREKGLSILIKPLKLFGSQQVDPIDKDRYILDMASAISYQLSLQKTEQDRQIIADAVEKQTWTNQVKEIIQVYISAIHLRREYLLKGS